MKSILSLILIVSFQLLFAQDSISAIKRTYIPISEYKKLNKPLTAKDSLGFMYRNGDTLVMVPNDFKLYDKDDVVRVPFTEKDSAFLKVYKSTVYNTDGRNGKRKPTSKIWIKDIKIYFENTVPKKHQNELMDFAKNLSSNIDSLNITEVNSRGKSNYLVYYINGEDDYDFEPRITNKEADYYLSWNSKQQLTRASVKVDTRNLSAEDDQLNKLKELFFSSLGYFKKTDRVSANSLISKSHLKKEITEVDREILKYHYDFGICKGTTLDSFEESHENFRKIKEMDPNSKYLIVHPKDYFKTSE